MNSILHINKPFERRMAFADYATRLSSVDGGTTGLIVVSVNGEGCGVACRVASQMEKHEAD